MLRARSSDSSKDNDMASQEDNKDTMTTMEHSKALKENITYDRVPEEDMVDYEASLECTSMEINVITFFIDYDTIGNDENVWLRLILFLRKHSSPN